MVTKIDNHSRVTQQAAGTGSLRPASGSSCRHQAFKPFGLPAASDLVSHGFHRAPDSVHLKCAVKKNDFSSIILPRKASIFEPQI